MAKKKVFISFDYEDDRDYRYLLSAWDRNTNFEFTFSDLTPSEIQSWRIDRIKAALTRKINQATHTLVIVGKNANKRHSDWREIGYRNWINFEVAKSKEHGKRLVAVRIEYHFVYPEELRNSNAVSVNNFNPDEIMRALNNA